MERRSFLKSIGIASGTTLVAGCGGSPDSGGTTGTTTTSEESTTRKTTATTTETTTTEQISARIKRIVDVAVQDDSFQNNIGFEVETTFENTATLRVTIDDSEQVKTKTYQATTTAGDEQTFNEDIDPPDSFKDGDRVTVSFELLVDSEVVDTASTRIDYTA